MFKYQYEKRTLDGPNEISSSASDKSNSGGSVDIDFTKRASDINKQLVQRVMRLQNELQMQNTKIEQMQQQNISTSLCGKGSEIGTQTIGALEPSNEHDYFEYYLIHLNISIL